MPAFSAWFSGRTNRFGNSVSSARPSLEVRIADWNSCTCAGPSAEFGADWWNFTPGECCAADWAPRAISCVMWCSMSRAPITSVRPNIEPTGRSISRIEIRNAMPAAMIPT